MQKNYKIKVEWLLFNCMKCEDGWYVTTIIILNARHLFESPSPVSQHPLEGGQGLLLLLLLLLRLQSAMSER